MPRKICIIDGHPDPDPNHLIHALSDAYEAGAREEGRLLHGIGSAHCLP